MLTKLLIHFFVKKGDPSDPAVRLSYGTLSGTVGIVINALLFVMKLSIGLLSGSIAIAADAVNNLSDAGSSAVTLYGFKLSAAPADEEHPFGHGRLEYLAGVIISVIIIAVGIDFMKESAMRIFHPEEMKMNRLMLGIYGGSVLFKLWLFLFYRSIGRIIKSKVLEASAFDSLSDILGTAVVLGAVIFSYFVSFPIDGMAGLVVAVLVILGGVQLLRDAANPLLGEMPDPELVKKLRTKLLSCKGINGVHDIILHNYGPNMYFATAHAEVSRNGDLLSIHDTLEAAEVEVAKALPVRLLLHCDPFDTEDQYIKDWRAKTEEAVSNLNRKFKLYDFDIDDTQAGKRILRFHLLITKNGELSCDRIREELTKSMRVYDPTIEIVIEFMQAYV